MEFRIGRLVIIFAFILAVALLFLIPAYHKNKNHLWITVPLFILYAIPMPASLLSIPFSFINIVSMFLPETKKLGSSAGSILLAALFTIVMLLAGSYLITYIISLYKTVKIKTVSCFHFLPMAHIILFTVLFLLTDWLEKNQT